MVGIYGSVIGLKHRGPYMSAHVLLNLLKELRKRDKMRGLPSILSLFRNKFNKFRPPSGTFKTFRNLYFGWNPLKPFIWLKNL